MKSKIKFICAAAAALLLILIFLSRTIYNFNLPSVTAVLPYRGTLTKTELTSGIVKYDEVSMLYSEKGGTVGKVLVREGDAVTKGQPLIQMNYKTSVNEVNKQIETVNTDLEKNINDIRINNDRLNLEIETINANIGNTKRKMGSLAQEVYEPESVSNFELIQSENEIAAAEADLGKSKLMYESGVISRQELENAENALKNLKLKYENTEQNYNDAVARSLEAVTDSEANRQSQLKDYEFQLEAYERELRGKNADLNTNASREAEYKREAEKKLADLNKELAEYESRSFVYAPEDSFIVSSDVDGGEYVGANQRLMSVSMADSFIIECDISMDNNFITAGDICELGNATHSLEGVVTGVKPGEQTKKVTVLIRSDEVTAGETFDIYFEKESGERYTLVPNGAINRDGDGYFLKRVQKRDGILGEEFYTDEVRVRIGDSDSTNTVISEGMDFFEPVALFGDKPFKADEAIKLRNESDFFEK